MDLRNFPEDMNASERVEKRRTLVEKETDTDLSRLSIQSDQIGNADVRNCEQMIGAIPMPIGIAGPLHVHYSSGDSADVYLPLATTEGALVASVNRGCKAVTQSGGVDLGSEYVGISRSVAFDMSDMRDAAEKISSLASEWKKVAEATSEHLKILSHEIHSKDDVVFLTLNADTDEAMGMNMVTIAAQAVGDYITKQLGIQMITVAGNVDSDKKPSLRTKESGRGHRVTAEVTLSDEIIKSVLKTDTDVLIKTAHAKLGIGSKVAGALGSNLHVANVLAALYLATGQDVAHVVEGSLADTTVTKVGGGVHIAVKLPAILVGVRGGGTELPAQKQCLDLILINKTSLRPTTQLSETIAGAVLAGEISLLAAQSTHSLASSHQKLARKSDSQ